MPPLNRISFSACARGFESHFFSCPTYGSLFFFLSLRAGSDVRCREMAAACGCSTRSDSTEFRTDGHKGGGTEADAGGKIKEGENEEREREREKADGGEASPRSEGGGKEKRTHYVAIGRLAQGGGRTERREKWGLGRGRQNDSSGREV